MHAPAILLALAGFVIVIGPLIFLHELGHYFAGRLFGVKAETFSIGMGREVAGWTDRRGTRWKLSLLPIGGYVKFAGDMGPASIPDPAWLRLPPEEKARTFQAKPLWQRFIIVAAGPLTNFAIAIAIFAAFFAIWGVLRTPPVVRAVVPNSAAARAGILPGDRILRLSGRSMGSFEDVIDYLRIRPDERVDIAIDRGGRPMTLVATVGTIDDVDPLGHAMRRGLLGVAPAAPQVVHVGPIGVLGEALRHTRNAVRMMVDVLGQIVGGRRSAQELGGPMKIAQISGETVSMGPLRVIEFMALISINLGFMNLLPIPMLDGGHLFFYVLEGIRRRPLPGYAQEWAFRSGLALLLGFMLFVTLNDLGSFGLWRKLASLIG